MSASSVAAGVTVRTRVLNPVHPSAFEGQGALRLDTAVALMVSPAARDSVIQMEHCGPDQTFQIEMQRQRHRGLDQRMVYGWARLYSEQLASGSEYATLRPVVSVWVCEEDPFPQAAKAHLRFRLLEVDERFALHDDVRFEVVQLSRVRAAGTGLDDVKLGGWCRLLNEAAQWREVPGVLHNPVLEEAMSVLNAFRTDSHLNQLYRGRQEYERVRAAELGELEDARAERDAAVAALEQARAAWVAAQEQAVAAQEQAVAAQEQAMAAKEAAQAEVARLAAELAVLRDRVRPGQS